jgi:hypothetical protein
MTNKRRRLDGAAGSGGAGFAGAGAGKEAAKRRGERERQAGLDPDDIAARWLEQQDPPPAPPASKSKFKSKELHRWREQQKRGG